MCCQKRDQQCLILESGWPPLSWKSFIQKYVLNKSPLSPLATASCHLRKTNMICPRSSFNNPTKKSPHHMWGSSVCFTHTARIIVQSCNLTLVQSFRAIVQSPHTKIFIHHHKMAQRYHQPSNTDVRTKWKEINRFQELLSSWPPTATLTFERSYIQIRIYM